MKRPAYFRFSEMSAHIPISIDEFRKAHRDCTETWPPPEVGQDELWEALYRCAMVEHEYFHHRSALSTTSGRFLFFLAGIVTSRVLDVFKDDEIVDRYRKDSAYCPYILSDELHCKDTKRNTLRKHSEAQVLEDFFWRPSHAKLSRLNHLREVSEKGEQNIFGLSPGNLWYQKNYKIGANLLMPTFDELEICHQCLSLANILEGIASWKEYAYVSRILWYRFGDKFGLTNRWLSLSQGSLTYRAVADRIALATGCNMSALLPGFILDIALTGPLSSDRPVRWSEAHPSWRLNRILSISESIPDFYRNLDNCDTPDDNIFCEFDLFVARELGWSSVRTNLQDMLPEITLAATENIPRDANGVEDIGPHVQDRYRLAFESRLDRLARFLTPVADTSGHEEDELKKLGNCTLPLFTEFSDCLSFGSGLDHGAMKWLPGYVLSTCVVNVMKALLAHGELRHLHAKDALSVFSKMNRSRLDFINPYREQIPMNRLYKNGFYDFMSHTLGFRVSRGMLFPKR